MSKTDHAEAQAESERVTTEYTSHFRDVFGGSELIEINRMAISELERERSAASQIEA